MYVIRLQCVVAVYVAYISAAVVFMLCSVGTENVLLQYAFVIMGISVAETIVYGLHVLCLLACLLVCLFVCLVGLSSVRDH